MLGAPSIPRSSAEWVGEHDTPSQTDRADFDAFYPTSLLVTGFDILFFWVARMIMMGCWFAKEVPMPDGSPRSLADSVPFREVYIHALVRDANREKMSKTKGNVVDPIEIVKQYGTDAVRFTLASMASPGTDIAFNVARTEGYRAFANKIWNAARFLFMNVDRAAELGITVDPAALGAMPTAADDAPLEARWIVAEFQATAAKVNQSLENYRYDDAANTIYQFFWGSFCDWYLEIVKLRLDFSETADKAKTGAALTTLVSVFEASLRLLSPFMPFLTEEIWHALYDGNPPTKSIALTAYPQAAKSNLDEIAQLEMQTVQELISEIRTLRKEIGVEEKAVTPIEVLTNPSIRKVIEDNCAIVERLAKVNDLHFVQEITVGLSKHSAFSFDVAVVYERTIDIAAERERLTKDIAKYEKGIVSAERQLGNEDFLKKAPPQVVEGLKKQEEETRLLLEKAQSALSALPAE
jgi:valyl-tRNA synthetase